tara:strand:+ start:239 stop:694 length:456 start_codon:yes stop_codon:yes gene_type:complete
MENKNYRTKKIMLDLFDPDLEKMVTEEAEQIIFKEPQLLENERIFEVGSAYHKPKQNDICIIPFHGIEIDNRTLLKIAHSFGIGKTQIKTWKDSNNKYQYSLPYDSKNGFWEEEKEVFKTVENDLAYEPAYCYGYTIFEGGNQIIHNKPIS